MEVVRCQASETKTNIEHLLCSTLGREGFGARQESDPGRKIRAIEGSPGHEMGRSPGGKLGVQAGRRARVWQLGHHVVSGDCFLQGGK